jgi:hypothetical protein
MYKCHNCGESKNLHFNYDYSKQHRPILEVMCNFCGEYFDGDMSVSDLRARYNEDTRLFAFLEKEANISDDFQIGPDGAYEHTEWDNTLMDGLHDEEFPDFESNIDNDKMWDQIYESYRGISDLHNFVDWLKVNYIAPEKIKL